MNGRTPMDFLKVTVLLILTVTCIHGAPHNDKSIDQENENNSKNLNEVGPSQEDWKLYEQLTKAKSSIDPSNDPEKIKKLFKEIEQYSQLVQTTFLPNVNDKNDNMGGSSQDQATQQDSETASSDWFDSLWREITGRASEDEDADRDSREDITTTETPEDIDSPQADEQQNEDDGPIEDIVKKLSNELKKLYNKIKQVIKVVKNWVDHRKEAEKLNEMSGSASEQDGVFVGADPIIGDVDKSNKYTLPINSE